MKWRPFWKREDSSVEGWDSPIEGVPEHLLPSLLGLIDHAVRQSPDLLSLLQRKLHLTIEQGSTLEGLIKYSQSPSENSIDVLDVIVSELWRKVSSGRNSHSLDANARDFAWFIGVLGNYFEEANVNFDVVKSGDSWRISRKASPELAQIYSEIVTSEDSTAVLMKSAWNSFFNHDHDYRKSYEYCVLALESVVCPFFIPNNRKPTLGQALSAMRDRRSDFGVGNLEAKAIGSSDLLITSIQTIWESQGRHVNADGQPPTEVTAAQAESALILTISIVQLFKRDLVFKWN